MEEVKKARSVFEQFAPEMREALESASLDEVNNALGGMGSSQDGQSSHRGKLIPVLCACLETAPANTVSSSTCVGWLSQH